MKIKNQRDFWSGLMFIAVGLAFAVGSTNYSMGSSARPGPGYFPLILSVIMAILGAIVLFKAMTIETDDGNPIGSIAWRPLLIVVAAIGFFGLALPRLGMLITVPILIVIVSLASTEFRLKGVLASAVVLTVGAWAIFIAGLKLTIPLYPWFAS